MVSMEDPRPMAPLKCSPLHIFHRMLCSLCRGAIHLRASVPQNCIIFHPHWPMMFTSVTTNFRECVSPQGTWYMFTAYMTRPSFSSSCPASLHPPALSSLSSLFFSPHSLTFSLDSIFLCCSSEKWAVHIFAIKDQQEIKVDLLKIFPLKHRHTCLKHIIYPIHYLCVPPSLTHPSGLIVVPHDNRNPCFYFSPQS